ncbi:NAD(P)-dependent oxidoreductase [Compostimonas suwonensis]|uniref:3-hydroxyisobutyrate dehydrogenase n=1 Tax=Compostimonas suwonensis TaxID=1048394 RepID=A0A2M9C551_9MICO|nr:NAD(P)-dependent oxidoreductase [Compostimonas suwonensis]PJJ65655.1 3-hydroxyisobutyrate dehydrogenase [Compostimonas suwonensis]
MKIGFLGVGRMGAPLAVALAERQTVTAYDPVPSRAGALESSGVSAAPSARAVVAGAETLITVLPGAPEFEAAADEVLETLAPGSLWIDLTSNDPRVADAVAPAAAARGLLFVAAPMAGGPEGAGSRRLRFLLGGDEEGVRRAREVLAPLAAGNDRGADDDGITVAGSRAGDAHLVKLLSNLLWFGQVVAVSEAMLLGRSLGVDPDRLLALLAAGPGTGTVVEQHFGAVLRGDYLADFGLDRVVEELDIVSSLAAERGMPFELSELVTRTHREALLRFGAVDGELLAARLLEERAGDPLCSGGSS